jgi:outer membrane protein assembly factor BamA
MGGGVAVSSSAVALSPERPYRFSASTDLFLPAFFYSSPGGFFWTSYWQGSDLLGDHQAAAILAFHSGQSYDYQADYQYRRYRPQLALGAYGMGRKDLVDQDTGQRFDDTLHGQYAAASYPLDRYHRLELGLSGASERVYYPDEEFRDDRQARMGYAAVVRDAVRGRYLVATAGNRLRLSVSEAAEVLGGNRRYHIAGVEGHQFFPTGGQSALAFRAVGMQALGRDHPDLILGGLGGVRGYGRSTTRDFGNRIAVANAEWRFPIFPDLNYYMWYMFPDLYFKAIFGTIFTDVGSAWRSEGEAGHSDMHKLRNSVGLGLRIYTFVLQEFPLFFSFDYAHRTTQNGGIFYFYLGSIF